MVGQVASRSGVADPSALRALALGLIAEALVSGLMVPGEVGDDGFRPWDSSVEGGLARVVERWLEWGTGPANPGAICWLDVTPLGEALGRSVLDRERPSSG